MQRKNKKFLTNLIIVLLVCSAAFYVALHVRIDDYTSESGVPMENAGEGAASSDEQNTEDEDGVPLYTEPETDENYTQVGFNLGEFLDKDIYINGYHINNWQLTEPFISVEGTIYAPMSESVMAALGISATLDDPRHILTLSPSGQPSLSGINEGTCACNLQYREVYWGHTYYINKNKVEGNLAVTTKDTDKYSSRFLYLSMEALEKYGGVDFSYFYDSISGLYISILKDVPASSFFSENNKKYIEGRARYMMSVNTGLTEKKAFRYEYLFRHEAANSPYLDQDQLMGICQTESRFVHVAQSEVDAIGLMQVMFIYAEPQGYTLEMLQEPHYNIQFGRSWFDMFCEQCGGNVEMALSAYYMGIGGVQSLIAETGSYSSDYSGVCISHKNMLESWVADNGYSNTFLEYVGK